jgi:hypothetical protein
MASFIYSQKNDNSLSMLSLSMSSSGQHIYGIRYDDNRYLRYSGDYGNTWNERQVYGLNVNSISVNSDGTYVAALRSNGIVYYSTNNGTTWEENTNYTGFTVNSDYKTIPNTLPHKLMAISKDANVQAVSTTNGLAVSRDRGITWNIISDFLCDYISISDNGNYILLSNQNNSNTNTAVCTLKFTNNNWTSIIKTFEIDNTYNRTSSAISGTGQYQTIIKYRNDSLYIFYSNNYGVTWSESAIANIQSRVNNIDIVYISISESGKYQLLSFGCDKSYIGFYSTSFGQTWYEPDLSPNIVFNDYLVSSTLSSSGKFAAISLGEDRKKVLIGNFVFKYSNPLVAAFAAAKRATNTARKQLEITQRTNAINGGPIRIPRREPVPVPQ